MTDSNEVYDYVLKAVENRGIAAGLVYGVSAVAFAFLYSKTKRDADKKNFKKYVSLSIQYRGHAAGLCYALAAVSHAIFVTSSES